MAKFAFALCALISLTGCIEAPTPDANVLYGPCHFCKERGWSMVFGRGSEPNDDVVARTIVCGKCRDKMRSKEAKRG